MTGLVRDMQMLYNLWGQGRRSGDVVSGQDITITHTQFVTYRPLIKFVKKRSGHVGSRQDTHCVRDVKMSY